MIHEINQSWIEKTSTEVLKSSMFGKMLFPFMSWPVKFWAKRLNVSWLLATEDIKMYLAFWS
jgi:hypothetical protein